MPVPPHQKNEYCDKTTDDGQLVRKAPKARPKKQHQEVPVQNRRPRPGLPIYTAPPPDDSQQFYYAVGGDQNGQHESVELEQIERSHGERSTVRA